MIASSSEVRHYAVAACAHQARGDDRTEAALHQARATVARAFAGNGQAMDLIGQIAARAKTVTDSRRYLQAHPFDAEAEADFQQAVERLECSTRQLITLTEQR